MRLADEMQQPVTTAGALTDAIADIGTIESGNETPCVVKSQARDNLFARGLVGSCRQGNARNAGKMIGKLAQADILGPEIVPPLRNTMRLIDRDQAERHLGEA